LYNSCASLVGLVLCFIAWFILHAIAPLLGKTNLPQTGLLPHCRSSYTLRRFHGRRQELVLGAFDLVTICIIRDAGGCHLAQFYCNRRTFWGRTGRACRFVCRDCWLYIVICPAVLGLTLSTATARAREVTDTF